MVLDAASATDRRRRIADRQSTEHADRPRHEQAHDKTGRQVENERVARLRIDDWSVTVSLSAAEKIEALHRNVRVPRTAVVGVRGVPDGMAEVHGKTTGTG